MTSTPTAARAAVAAELATIGVVLPARSLQVKGGRVVTVYMAHGTAADRLAAVAALLGGTVRENRIVLR